MANLLAVHSLSSSLLAYLKNAYPPESLSEQLSGQSCDFRSFSSGRLAELDTSNMGTTIGLFIHRIAINDHMRNAININQASDNYTPLSIDIHFILSIWTNSSFIEQTLAVWIMNELHHHPVMDISSLSPDGKWGPDEIVQIIPAELSNEEVMRIWDSLVPNYRFSMPYTARVIRIDPKDKFSGKPVVATKFNYSRLINPNERETE